MRVLVVEDQRLLAETLATGLRREGMAVDVVLDGVSATERAGVVAYDVIVLDRDLPGLHGDDVCREVVARGGGTKVLMLTAAGDLEDRVQGLTIGADDYLAKPFAFCRAGGPGPGPVPPNAGTRTTTSHQRRSHRGPRSANRPPGRPAPGSHAQGARHPRGAAGRPRQGRQHRGAAGPGTMQSGTFLNSATARFPSVVLGAVAAQRLGIDRVGPDERVWLGNQWFYVSGIMGAFPLAPEIDRAVLVGFPVAESLLGFNGAPTTVYVRADPNQVQAVESVLAATANPEHPDQANVSRPSDALVARADAQSAFTGLFLGLGAIALLVGGVGVANIMVISVLERRSEIGLRRALGATRGQVRFQFLSEAVLLSVLGGACGVVMGVIVTAIYASTRSWAVVVPPTAIAGGLAGGLVIGAVAGVLPAMRAAGLAPTEALRTA